MANLPTQDIVERLFEDIRDRRFLKWLFPEFEGAGPILHDQYGDPLMPFDLDVQEEIKAAWAAIIGHALSRLTADNEALRKERDEARAAHHRTSHKAVKRLRALWREKQAAETCVTVLEAEVGRLREALKPFATYLDIAKFDLDNKGLPLPDDLGMGWVYLTVGNFRRARAALANEEAGR